MAHERSAIVCPSCGKRYAIPEGSIGPEGRTVRCAACRHSWTAHPEQVTPASPAIPVPDASEEAARDAGVASPPTIEEVVPPPTVEPVAEPVTQPAVELVTTPEPTVEHAVEPAVEHTVVRPEEPAVVEGAEPVVEPTAEFVPAQMEAPVTARSRRRLTKALTVTGAAAAIVGLGGAGFLLMTAQPVQEPQASALSIRIADRPIRQQAPDGRQVISTTAEIFNPGRTARAIPAMKATMRTPDGQVVKEWRVASPGGTLAPNARTTVSIGTTAGADIPRGPLKLDVDMIERATR